LPLHQEQAAAVVATKEAFTASLNEYLRAAFKKGKKFGKKKSEATEL